MPPNTVKVDRSTKWGNPFKIGGRGIGGHIEDADDAKREFGMMLDDMVDAEVRGWGTTPLLAAVLELRGKNLACWCKPGTPCHADVLLELANAQGTEAQRAETVEQGSVHDGPVGEADAPKNPPISSQGS